MANNYQFLDANASILTAASSVVAGAHQQIVQIGGSVITVSTPVSNQSVSGQIGASIIGLTPVNIVGPASVSGVGIFNTNPIGNGSMLVVVPGSVATAPSPASISGVGVFNTNNIGNGSVITLNQGGSILAVPVGSTIAVIQAASVAGTYPEDAGHVSADRGLFTLNVRNDTTSSFVSANQDYTPTAVDEAGRTITKPFASGFSSIFGTGSVNGAASVILIGAPPTGLRNYITDIWIANTGTAATLVRFTAGGASVLGFTIAPAGSGSNLPGLATPIAVQAGSPFNIAADTASSVVYGTAYGYTAP